MVRNALILLFDLKQKSFTEIPDLYMKNEYRHVDLRYSLHFSHLFCHFTLNEPTCEKQRRRSALW